MVHKFRSKGVVWSYTEFNDLVDVFKDGKLVMKLDFTNPNTVYVQDGKNLKSGKWEESLMGWSGRLEYLGAPEELINSITF